MHLYDQKSFRKFAFIKIWLLLDDQFNWIMLNKYNQEMICISAII